MGTRQIQDSISSTISSEIRLKAEGNNRYVVFTPFRFDDGDSFVIILKKVGDNWFYTDEGNTLMHLSYYPENSNLRSGEKGKVIQEAVSEFETIDKQGEFLIKVEGDNFGSALFSFIQFLSRVSDITLLQRERVHRAFISDFKSFIELEVPTERATFGWYDKAKDPKKLYKVDCKVEGERSPIFIFALQSESKVKDSIIAIHHLRSWGYDFSPMGIFENQEAISRSVLAKFSDTGAVQFSTLRGNEAVIKEQIQKLMH
jgi:hypothetical protein